MPFFITECAVVVHSSPTLNRTKPMRCNFFAAEDDLHAVLEQVENARELHYAVAGLHTALAVPTDISWRSLAPFHAREQSFLVLERQFPLVVRPIAQNTGGTLFAVDELANPNAVSLVPGVAAGALLVLPGVIGTSASDGAAVSLVRSYKSAFAKHFTKVKAYWVGPRAMQRWRDGARLTVSAEASSEFDLVGEEPRAV